MNTSSALEKIERDTRERLRQRKLGVPFETLRQQSASARTPHPFAAPFAGPGIRVIAEVKFASPSQGSLATVPVGGAARVASEYLSAGATALSVLTEETYFCGSEVYLREIRKAHPQALLLMKDFVVDAYQLHEAKVNGADAALLITALLGAQRLQQLLQEAQALGLTALVEVHDADELAIATKCGAQLIGINNRNLRTLEVSLDPSFALVALAPKGVPLISESGIENGAQVRSLAKVGFSACLIGSSLMRTGRPGEALAQLLSQASDNA